jgi:1-aminocyclopropane-1-carboxylate deaminase/D-cysteine desulfhydrase-like pyridoxal-dependent ACC family enzyme
MPPKARKTPREDRQDQPGLNEPAQLADLDYIHPDLRGLAVKLDSLLPDPKNARKHNDANLAAIRASLKRFGVRKPIVVQRAGDQLIVRSGNGRMTVAKELGWTHLPAIVVDEGDDDAIAFALADNRTADLAEWDMGVLEELATSGVQGFDWEAFQWGDLAATELDVAGSAGSGAPKADTQDGRRDGRLVQDFGAPPFSVLDTRQGYWQARKREWLALGIQSELGRGADLAFHIGEWAAEKAREPGRGRLKWDAGPRPRAGKGRESGPVRAFNEEWSGGDVWAGSRKAADLRSNVTGAPALPEYADNGTAHMAPGTSIFDPVLTELLVRWFTPEGGRVLDPFAGGSVRGVVTAKLGRSYVGCELRPEQVEANRAQAVHLNTPQATWVQGDSRITLDTLDGEFDAILSCPPYYDLEIYSERPEDLSAVGTYEEFLTGYREIIAKAVAKLADNSFACWVVGDLRDKRGFYRNFVGDTVQAFHDAGAQLYNEAILVNPVGTLALRAPKQFRAGRKLGKTHQNVLVFFKGDPRKIKDRLGDLTDTDEPDTLEDNYLEGQTPIQAAGPYWVKRDDLFTVAGVPGGKVRTCWALAQGAKGLVTAGSRQSPQVNIVAHIAQRLGVPCRVHVPSGDLTPELEAAQDAGAELVQHRPGYNTVIVARAREDAEQSGWTEIPFGMECEEAVRQTAGQVPAVLPEGVKRIVMPVGSGMSLAGVLAGLAAHGHTIPVLGVQVGADPTKRLDTYAAGWRSRATLVKSELDYHDHAPVQVLHGIQLDPVYEAKCLAYLEPGDLLWVVGIRGTSQSLNQPAHS